MKLRLRDNFCLGVSASALLLASSAAFGLATSAQAAGPPTYSVNTVLIPPYELDVPFAAQAPTGFSVAPTAAPVFKPHEVAIDRTRNIWISSNERGEHGNTNQYNPDGTRVGQFRAGISIFQIGTNAVLAKLIIDEPQFAEGAQGYPGNGILGPVADPYTSSTGWLHHGMDLLGTQGAGSSGAAGEDTGETECPSYPPGYNNAFVQTVLMPVVLPPNSHWDPKNFKKLDPLGRTDPSGQVVRVAGKDPRYGNAILVGYDAYGRASIMMPMGAECHPRHPHGNAIDRPDGLVYELIEHMGLSWNLNRTDFVIATTTDEESGGSLVFDISDVNQPKIVTAYMSGHGAHEVEVSQQNGLVFMPDHEESGYNPGDKAQDTAPPAVEPDIFQTVVNPFVGLSASAKAKLPLAAHAPSANEYGVYGLIDTGYYQALQDLAIDDGPGADNTV